jgi:hypothetical protein
VNDVIPVKRLCAAIDTSATSKSLEAGAITAIVEKSRPTSSTHEKADESKDFRPTFAFADHSIAEYRAREGPARTHFSRWFALRW